MTLSPTRVIPIHWHSLTVPLDGPFTGEVRIADFISGGSERALEFLQSKQAANPIPTATCERLLPATRPRRPPSPVR